MAINYHTSGLKSVHLVLFTAISKQPEVFLKKVFSEYEIRVFYLRLHVLVHVLQRVRCTSFSFQCINASTNAVAPESEFGTSRNKNNKRTGLFCSKMSILLKVIRDVAFKTVFNEVPASLTKVC